MTKQELIEKLEKFPNDTVIMVHDTDMDSGEYFEPITSIATPNYKGKDVIVLA